MAVDESTVPDVESRPTTQLRAVQDTGRMLGAYARYAGEPVAEIIDPLLRPTAERLYASLPADYRRRCEARWADESQEA